MRNETAVSAWGDSLAVRIPESIVKKARIAEGDRLVMDIDSEGAIVMRLARRKYELAELVRKTTSRNRHGETDWGPRMGGEA